MLSKENHGQKEISETKKENDDHKEKQKVISKTKPVKTQVKPSKWIPPSQGDYRPRIIPRKRVLSKKNKEANDAIVIADGPEISPTSLARARDEAIRRELESICRDIRTPGTYLQDQHVDRFIAVANRTHPQGSEMKRTLICQRTSYYEPLPGQELINDVQILYLGPVGESSQGEIAHVGHYICIHYNANDRMVYIYDSVYIGMSIF